MKNLLFYTLFILKYSTFAFSQDIIIFNSEDKEKYSFNPLTEWFINDNAFKDGSYIFYRDSLISNPIFEGFIKNGKTNGNYYSYDFDDSGNIIPTTKTIIPIINGNISGILNKSVNLNGVNINKYLFNFQQGELMTLKIINPFFRYFYSKQDSLGPFDTLNFIFKKGKLISMNFNNCDLLYKINPPLNYSIYDTIGLSVIHPSDVFVLKNSNIIDTMHYYKKYKFSDTLTAESFLIYVYYNHEKLMRNIVVGSTFRNLPYPLFDKSLYTESNPHNFSLLNLELDNFNSIRYVELTKALTTVLYNNDAEFLDERVLINSLELYFKNEGVLDNK